MCAALLLALPRRFEALPHFFRLPLHRRSRDDNRTNRHQNRHRDCRTEDGNADLLSGLADGFGEHGFGHLGTSEREQNRPTIAADAGACKFQPVIFCESGAGGSGTRRAITIAT